MATIYEPKGIHTSPCTAGEDNLKGKKLPTGGGVNDKIYPVLEHGKASGYEGRWSEEQFAEAIDNFFIYCVENDVKPTQPLIRLWLGVSRSQFHAWRSEPERYGWKSDLSNHAMDYMEAYLQANIDSYPTGSIFLLKSSHGHNETTKVEITNGNSKDDVKDLVSKLGLNEESD